MCAACVYLYKVIDVYQPVTAVYSYTGLSIPVELEILIGSGFVNALYMFDQLLHVACITQQSTGAPQHAQTDHK